MTKQPDKDARLLELGVKLQNFYDLGYISRKEAILFSFLKGLASGVGAFVGGSLVITLILWILSIFGHVPFIGEIVKTVQQSLHK